MFRTDLIGNLGQDPEVRFTQKGVPMVNLRVAVNLRQRDENGEYKDATEWVGVRVMGRQADYAKTFAKGTRIYVTGALDVRQFKRRDGTTDKALDVWADEIVALTSAREADGSVPAAARDVARQTRPGAGAEDEDLPF